MKNPEELLHENFDYVIPVNKSCIRYSSSQQLLKITLATDKYGDSIFIYKNISPDLFGKVCSYFGMGSNNLDIFRMIERLNLMNECQQEA